MKYSNRTRNSSNRLLRGTLALGLGALMTFGCVPTLSLAETTEAPIVAQEQADVNEAPVETDAINAFDEPEAVVSGNDEQSAPIDELIKDDEQPALIDEHIIDDEQIPLAVQATTEFNLPLNNQWQSCTIAKGTADNPRTFTFKIDKPSLVELWLENRCDENPWYIEWALYADDATELWYKRCPCKCPGTDYSYMYLNAGTYSVRMYGSTSYGTNVDDSFGGDVKIKGRATATTYPVCDNDSYTKAVNMEKGVAYKGLSTCDGSADAYYKFTLSKDAKVRIVCNEEDSKNSSFDAMGLYDSNMKELWWHCCLATFFSKETVLSAGTYYVRVNNGYSGSSRVDRSGPYTIKWTASSLDLADGQVSLSPNKYTYDGTQKTPDVTVKLNGDKLSGSYYTVAYQSGRINAGTYKVTVTGKDSYMGSKVASFTIGKASNPIKVKSAKRAVKASKVRKKAVQVAKPLAVTGAKGKVSYKKVGGSKQLSINAKTGKVTVQKKTKKGTYKIKVKVTATGNRNYKSKSRTVTCKVTVQ